MIWSTARTGATTIAGGSGSGGANRGIGWRDGAQSPKHPQALAHGLDLGTHPLERQRVPRREELDRVRIDKRTSGRARDALRRSR